MNIKEVAIMFGVAEKDKSMKNKNKANEILSKILKCRKCGGQMKWIKGTNICVCPTCTYSVEDKNREERICSISKTLLDKNRKFLESNYHYIFEEGEEV